MTGLGSLNWSSALENNLKAHKELFVTVESPSSSSSTCWSLQHGVFHDSQPELEEDRERTPSPRRSNTTPVAPSNGSSLPSTSTTSIPHQGPVSFASSSAEASEASSTFSTPTKHGRLMYQKHHSGVKSVRPSGEWCHQCKQKHTRVLCCTGSCTKKYCHRCLERHYNFRVSSLDAATWLCPYCQHQCTCALCQRAIDQSALDNDDVSLNKGSSSGLSSPRTRSAQLTTKDLNEKRNDDDEYIEARKDGPLSPSKKRSRSQPRPTLDLNDENERGMHTLISQAHPVDDESSIQPSSKGAVPSNLRKSARKRRAEASPEEEATRGRSIKRSRLTEEGKGDSKVRTTVFHDEAMTPATIKQELVTKESETHQEELDLSGAVPDSAAISSDSLPLLTLEGRTVIASRLLKMSGAKEWLLASSKALPNTLENSQWVSATSVPPELSSQLRISHTLRMSGSVIAAALTLNTTLPIVPPAAQSTREQVEHRSSKKSKKKRKSLHKEMTPEQSSLPLRIAPSPRRSPGPGPSLSLAYSTMSPIKAKYDLRSGVTIKDLLRAGFVKEGDKITYKEHEKYDADLRADGQLQFGTATHKSLSDFARWVALRVERGRPTMMFNGWATLRCNGHPLDDLRTAYINYTVQGHLPKHAGRVDDSLSSMEAREELLDATHEVSATHVSNGDIMQASDEHDTIAFDTDTKHHHHPNHLNHATAENLFLDWGTRAGSGTPTSPRYTSLPSPRYDSLELPNFADWNLNLGSESKFSPPLISPTSSSAASMQSSTALDDVLLPWFEHD